MDYNPYKHGITQGLLLKFMSCRQKTKWFLEGWTTASTSPALIYGSVIHGGIELVYKAYREDELSRPPSSKFIDEVLNRVRLQWKTENPNPKTKTIQDLEYALAMAEIVLPLYFDYWKKDDLRNIQWKDLEDVFKIPIQIGKQKTYVRGRIDGSFKCKGLWLFETKTKSQVVEINLLDTLSYEFQVLTYCWILLQKYKCAPRGVLYNIVRKTGLRRNASESFSQYLARVKKDIEKRSDHYFIRYEVFITKKELRDFEDELRRTLGEFLNWWENGMLHSRNTSQCIGRYGRCRYIPLCSANQFNLFKKREIVFEELEN